MIIALAGIVALYGVRVLDLNVYHKMLRGAVKFGEDFEENYMKEIFVLQKGMTQAITFFSQFEDASTTRQQDRKYSYQGTAKKNALEKIKRFYNVLMLALFVLSLVLFLARNFGHTTGADRVAGPPAIEKSGTPIAGAAGNQSGAAAIARAPPNVKGGGPTLGAPENEKGAAAPTTGAPASDDERAPIAGTPASKPSGK